MTAIPGLMQRALLAAAALLLLGPASSPDPAWQRCEADADCVASFGPCGEWVATARATLKAQQDWARQAGRAMSCPENRSPQPPVTCRDRRCALVLTAPP